MASGVEKKLCPILTRSMHRPTNLTCGWRIVLPQVSQRRAWVEHTACIGANYLNHDVDVQLGYCVLSKLGAEMLDRNCTGIYIPRENRLIPNDESLYSELQRVAAARDSRVTATPTPV